MNNLRIVIGFFSAPLIPAGLIAIFSDPMAAMVVTIIGYPAILVFGVPVFLVLRRLMWVSWSAYVTMGFLVGAFIEILMTIDSMSISGIGLLAIANHVIESTSQRPLSLLVLSWSGGISALTFWLIARPDKIDSSPLTTGFRGHSP